MSSKHGALASMKANTTISSAKFSILTLLAHPVSGHTDSAVQTECQDNDMLYIMHTEFQMKQ